MTANEPSSIERLDELARRLPKPQQRALLRARNGFVLLAPGWTRWRLYRKGLIAPWLFKGSWTLTDAGFAVASALRAHASQGDAS